LLTGASLGNDSDGLMANAGVVARRMPFQADAALRRKINSGEVMFIDQHLSETAEQLRSGDLKSIDIAVIEAVAITPDGGIIPTMSVGNTANFAQQAGKVIVEINLVRRWRWKASTISIFRAAVRTAAPFRC
jgi:succinyl-CoA:acetate CoA-transferase